MRTIRNTIIDEGFFAGPIVTYRDRTGRHTVEIEAGGLMQVVVQVFREKQYTYVLSWNRDHGYVGIERFMGEKRKGNLYFGTKQSIEDILGKSGLELTPISMAKRLAKRLI